MLTEGSPDADYEMCWLYMGIVQIALGSPPPLLNGPQIILASLYTPPFPFGNNTFKKGASPRLVLVYLYLYMLLFTLDRSIYCYQRQLIKVLISYFRHETVSSTDPYVFVLYIIYSFAFA